LDVQPVIFAVLSASGGGMAKEATVIADVRVVTRIFENFMMLIFAGVSENA